MKKNYNDILELIEKGDIDKAIGLILHSDIEDLPDLQYLTKSCCEELEALWKELIMNQQLPEEEKT